MIVVVIIDDSANDVELCSSKFQCSACQVPDRLRQVRLQHDRQPVSYFTDQRHRLH